MMHSGFTDVRLPRAPFDLTPPVPIQIPPQQVSFDNDAVSTQNVQIVFNSKDAELSEKGEVENDLNPPLGARPFKHSREYRERDRLCPCCCPTRTSWWQHKKRLWIVLGTVALLFVVGMVSLAVALAFPSSGGGPALPPPAAPSPPAP
ncbi:MAG: hypothetical protein MHM6MM_004047 [Cercozoa sp. M6MM]